MVNSSLSTAVGRDSASPAPGSAQQDAQGPSQAANGSPVRQQADSNDAQAPAVPDMAGGGAVRQDVGTLKRKLIEPLPTSTDSPQDLGSGGLQQQSEADSEENARPEADESLQSEGGPSAAGLPVFPTDPAAAAAAAAVHKGKALHAAAAASKASGGGSAEALAGDGQAPAAERSSSQPAGLGGAGLGRGKGAPARGKKSSAGRGRTSAVPPAVAAALLRAAAASSTPDAAGLSSSGSGAGTSSGHGQQACLLRVHDSLTQSLGVVQCCLAPGLPVDGQGEKPYSCCHAIMTALPLLCPCSHSLPGPTVHCAQHGAAWLLKLCCLGLSSLGVLSSLTVQVLPATCLP